MPRPRSELVATSGAFLDKAVRRSGRRHYHINWAAQRLGEAEPHRDPRKDLGERLGEAEDDATYLKLPSQEPSPRLVAKWDTQNPSGLQ